MDPLKQYLVGVIATALICSLVQTFPQKGAARDLSKVFCGLVLSVVILAPLKHLSFAAPTDFIISFSPEIHTHAQKGEDMAKQTLRDIIKSETESYILDKAAEIGATIRVTVSVSDSEMPIPTEAILSGSTTSEIRNLLQEILVSDLGITKENQTWIGQTTPAGES